VSTAKFTITSLFDLIVTDILHVVFGQLDGERRRLAIVREDVLVVAVTVGGHGALRGVPFMNLDRLAGQRGPAEIRDNTCNPGILLEDVLAGVPHGIRKTAVILAEGKCVALALRNQYIGIERPLGTSRRCGAASRGVLAKGAALEAIVQVDATGGPGGPLEDVRPALYGPNPLWAGLALGDPRGRTTPESPRPPSRTPRTRRAGITGAPDARRRRTPRCCGIYSLAALRLEDSLAPLDALG